MLSLTDLHHLRAHRNTFPDNKSVFFRDPAIIVNFEKVLVWKKCYFVISPILLFSKKCYFEKSVEEVLHWTSFVQLFRQYCWLWQSDTL